MVSLDLIRYREEVTRALLARKNELDQEWDPFVASWLAYAFLCRKSVQSLLVQEMFQRLNTWSGEESAWQFRRNIGPLLFLVWLSRQLNLSVDASYIEKIAGMFQDLNPNDKFSPLRYPEQVFLMALGISALARTELRDDFLQVISSRRKGAPARLVLFTAALRELGERCDLPMLQPADVTDILALVWWAERYGDGADRQQSWSQFEGIADTILLSKVEEFDTRRVLSDWELVMLYEALIHQTSNPDPKMLFDYYPIHPRVRGIAEQDFKSGNYFGAVFEACKVLEDYLKVISGSTQIGIKLAQDVLGDPNMNPKNFRQPKIKINDLDQTSVDFVSQLDEQKGFASLVIGIFQAFRNPKGHQPKDKHWVGIDAYEALDQLVVISLVLKRLEKVTGTSP